MSVFGKMRINKVFSTDKRDILGVFKDGKCIGKNYCVYDSNLDMWYVMLTIYSNNVQDGGFSYRIWDASTNTVFDAVPSMEFNFSNNSIIGTPGNPVIFDGATAIYQNIDVEAGWNWISFNLYKALLSNVDSTLIGGSWTRGDVVKTMTNTDTYSTSTQKWQGALSAAGGFNNHEMFWLKSTIDQSIPVSGIHIDTISMTLKPNAWNPIAYLPLVNLPVKTALASYDAVEGDVIKGQTAFAMFYNNNWVGSLKYMEPGKGYMLRNTASTAKMLIYPQSTASTTLVPAQKSVLSNAKEYNENMTIIATCEQWQVGSKLEAYIDGQLRGVAEVIEINGKERLFLTVMGESNSNNLNILFVLEGSDLSQAISSTVLPYYANSMQGSIDNPIEIEFNEIDNEVVIYPVPYNQQVTVSGVVKESGKVRIQFIDANGRVVLQSERMNVQAGNWFQKQFNTSALTPGVYLIKIVQGNQIISTQTTIKE